MKIGNVSIDNMMSVVKMIKSESSLDMSCENHKTILRDDVRVKQVKAVEQQLQVESTERILETLTNEELRTAAEMFTYLNTCPDSWYMSWSSFYRDLFLTKPADQIILTLNRMMKTPKTSQNKDDILGAEKLFNRTASVLSLKFREMPSSLPEMGFISDLSINHPVHILTRDHQISPSAFIPFCDFGGNMSAMGVKIDQFAVPVCNSFQAKIMNDQLCYEVDINRFSNKNNIENELKLGFNVLMDYNEDRQVTFDQNISKKELGLAYSLAASDQDHHAFIYLDTIGRNIYVT